MSDPGDEMFAYDDYPPGFGVDHQCTCHPDDKPPVPCAKRYALTECREQVFLRRIVDRAWNEATESTAVPSTDWADRIIDRARTPK